MTRAEIKEKMESIIRGSFDPTAREEIADLIEEEDITEYLWSKDWGLEIFRAFMEEYNDDLKNDLLDEIYDEIEIEGLDW